MMDLNNELSIIGQMENIAEDIRIDLKRIVEVKDELLDNTEGTLIRYSIYIIGTYSSLLLNKYSGVEEDFQELRKIARVIEREEIEESLNQKNIYTAKLD